MHDHHDEQPYTSSSGGGKRESRGDGLDRRLGEVDHLRAERNHPATGALHHREVSSLKHLNRPYQPGCPGTTGDFSSFLGFQSSEQAVETLLRIPEEHHALRVVVELVINSGEAWAEAALEDDDRLGAVDFQDRHAIERTILVVLCGRVRHVVRTDNQGNVCFWEVRVDLFHRVQLVVGYVRLGEQNVHVARHAAGDRVNGVFHIYAARGQQLCQLTDAVLSLCDRHPITRYDDD